MKSREKQGNSRSGTRRRFGGFPRRLAVAAESVDRQNIRAAAENVDRQNIRAAAERNENLRERTELKDVRAV